MWLICLFCRDIVIVIAIVLGIVSTLVVLVIVLGILLIAIVLGRVIVVWLAILVLSDCVMGVDDVVDLPLLS